MGFLLDEIRLRGASPELVDEVKRIGREYNIVTPYTSFLVVEEGRRLARARGVDERKIRFGLDGGLDGVDSFHLALDEDAEAKESVRLLDDLSTATSGESAVAGSLAAKALGGALAPATSQPARGRGEALSRAVTRSVGDHTFQWIGSAWVDTNFTEADRAKVIKVAFLSDEYFALLRKHPELAKPFAIGAHVLVQCSGSFYEVE